jgi:murein DD-endopeptidase MepM/ murein hydrolase activator NlpD
MKAPAWINPVEGFISSPGGIRQNPVTGRNEFHDGIDIACPVGTDVFATRNGRVVNTGWSPSYGNYVRLALDGGYKAVYAHLDKILVKADEPVTQGQIIALSGNTGRSTGPHLHYGLFKDGQYVNPGPLVNLPTRAELAMAEP